MFKILGVRLASRPGRFILGNQLRYTWNMRLADPQSQSGRFAEAKTLPGLELRTVSRQHSRWH